MTQTSHILRIVSLLLAAFVALRELVYYMDHPYRSGPSLTIALLAIAVVLLAAAGFARPNHEGRT